MNNGITIDLESLKLALIERIAKLDDKVHLLALKRLLDGPPTYAPPGNTSPWCAKAKGPT